MGMEDRHVLEGHREMGNVKSMGMEDRYTCSRRSSREGEIGPPDMYSNLPVCMLTRNMEESGDGGGCDEKPGQAMAS